MLDAELGSFLRRHRLAINPSATRLGRFERLPARVGRTVTQEEMAEALDVSRTWYALLEAGTSHASSELALRIADVLGLSAGDRLTLMRLAVPGVATALSHVDPLETAEIATPQSAAISIDSPDAIEEAARRLAAIRERFLSTGVILEGTRHRIASSWVRCRTDAVDAGRRFAPLPFAQDSQIEELRGLNERLLRAAYPIVHSLVDLLASSGYVVVLSDGLGRIVELDGDAGVRRQLTKIDFTVGADWSEHAAGTNAIGTALIDARPMQLMSAEHFCDGWQHLTCTAAPIRDPRTHEIIGILDITGGYRLVRSHLLALIMQCALEIEEELAILGGAVSFNGAA